MKKALSFEEASSRELRVLETFFSESRIEGVKLILEEKITIVLRIDFDEFRKNEIKFSQTEVVIISVKV